MSIVVVVGGYTSLVSRKKPGKLLSVEVTTNFSQKQGQSCIESIFDIFFPPTTAPDNFEMHVIRLYPVFTWANYRYLISGLVIFSDYMSNLSQLLSHFPMLKLENTIILR